MKRLWIISLRYRPNVSQNIRSITQKSEGYCLGSEEHGSIQSQYTVTRDNSALFVWATNLKKIVTTSLYYLLKDGATKNKFIWLLTLWKCIKGATLLIDSAVEQPPVLLSKQFLHSTDNSRWNFLVPSLSLFSLFLFLRLPLPSPLAHRPHPRHVPLANSLAAMKLKL